MYLSYCYENILKLKKQIKICAKKSKSKAKKKLFSRFHPWLVLLGWHLDGLLLERALGGEQTPHILLLPLGLEFCILGFVSHLKSIGFLWEVYSLGAVDLVDRCLDVFLCYSQAVQRSFGMQVFTEPYILNKKKNFKNSKQAFTYSLFHKTLPKCSLLMHRF